jgi:carbonic anhydrase
MIVVLLAALPFTALAADSAPRWSYAGKDGPAAWGRLHKDFAACGIGHKQSPIDITTTQKENLPAIEFNYQPSTLKVLNNGRTVQVNVDAGSFITVVADSYRLVQYQVHTPSEERIQGKAFDMSLHLLHVNDAGELAMVAVLFKQGNLNTALQPLWRNMPTTVVPERTIEGVRLNPADLLPANKGYYSFEGSLTTPPCSEGVRWFVLREPVEMSKAQALRIKAIFHSNARPVQPLRGRVVKESQ